jgi:hypothetical protein
MFARPLRLPLATGASTIRSLSIPVGVFQLVAFGPLFLPWLPDWIVIPLGVVWAAWFFTVVAALIEGFRRRASDVVLAPDGITLRGGPSRGFHAAWDGIRPTACAVTETAGEGGSTWGLTLAGQQVATTEDEDERRSFQAIVDTVRAVRGGSGEAARRPAPEVFTCASCGAPVAPRDEEEIACRSCGAKVPIPAALRAQIQGLARLEGSRARSERLLGVLLRQRGAGFTNLLVLLATPPLILGGPLAAILFNEMYETRHVVRWTHGVALFVCGLTFTYGLSLLVRAQVVGRAALRLVALRFSAAPPVREGEPWVCRCCGAPLPEATERVVVLCAYCRAENVTGIDLRPQADGMAQQAGDLAATLEERLRVRRRWRGLSLLSAVMLMAGAGALYGAFFGACRDGVRDGDETDVDCGGSCLRCEAAQACGEGADCRSGICREGRCTAPACDDGVRNGHESDVDCGGDCAPCAAGKQCDASSRNCASGHCALGGRCE